MKRCRSAPGGRPSSGCAAARARSGAPAPIVDVRTGLSEDELAAAIPDYDALLVRSATTVSRRVIESAGRLRAIGRAGVGVDNIDVDAATDRGIVVVNAPTGNTVSAAELTIAHFLALSRHIPAADASLRGGAWNRSAYLGVELRGKTAGVVGLGQVGGAVAHRLLGLEMTVPRLRPPSSPTSAPACWASELVSFEELLARSDFVTLHTNLTPGAPPLLGRDEFAAMRSGARLINCARGALIDEAALIEALDSGRIAGAGPRRVQRRARAAGNRPRPGSPRVVVSGRTSGASTQEAQGAGRHRRRRRGAAGCVEGPPRLDRPSDAGALRRRRRRWEAARPLPQPCADTAGRLVTQIAEGRWQSLRIEYRGEIADQRRERAQGRPAVGRPARPESGEEHGQTSSRSDKGAAMPAAVHLVEEKSDDAGLYANLITVRLRTDAGRVLRLRRRWPTASRTSSRSTASASTSPATPITTATRTSSSSTTRTAPAASAPSAPPSASSASTSAPWKSDVRTRPPTSGTAIMVLTVDRQLEPAEVAALAAIPGIDDVTQAEI